MNIEIEEAYLIFNKRKNLIDKYKGIVLRESEKEDFKEECYKEISELLGKREEYNDIRQEWKHHYFIDLQTKETKKDVTWRKQN